MNTTKKNRESENSVMVALNELCNLEQERVVEETAKAEEAARLEAEREEARRLEAEERAAEQARLEAETKARVEAELKRRDEEAEARMFALRTELAAVRAAREATQMELAARLQATPTKRSRGTIQIAALMAAAVAMVIGGAAFLKSGDGQAAEPGDTTPIVEVVETEPEVEVEPVVPEVETEVVEAETVPEPKVAKPGRKPGKGGKNPKNPKNPKVGQDKDWTSNLTCDDPMGCGKGPRLEL